MRRFLKFIFYFKTNPLILGLLCENNYINHEVYEVKVTGLWKEMNVTTVFEKFIVFLNDQK